MDKERFSVLMAETQAQLRAIDEIYAKLDERKEGKGQAAVESMGYQLHNLYCAVEDLFKIIAAGFENHIQDKTRYHSELLKRMTIAIEGVRPSVLSRHSFVYLDNLRAFRHFFRHAYSYELDERKVRLVLDDAYKVREIFRNEINAFLGSIKTS